MSTTSAPPHTSGRAARAAFVQLARLSGADMLRNPLTGLSMFCVFVTMLVIYIGMWLAFSVLGPAPSLTVVADSAADATLVIAELEDRGLTSVADGTTGVSEADATVTLSGDGLGPGTSAKVLLKNPDHRAWDRVWLALRAAGVPSEGVVVVDTQGDVKMDPLRQFLGVAAMTGIASIAFIGTAVPLVAMRERGLMRLLGTTPLRRSTFLAAQLPSRVAIAFAEVAIVVAIAVWRGYVDGLNVLSFAVTCVLGTAMLFAIAVLCATRARNAEATQQGMAMLTIMLVFVSGGLLPPGLLPEFVQLAMNVVPTSWLASAAAADLTGAETFLPVPVLWGLMALAAGVAAAAAAWLFQWDQAEGPRSRTTAVQH